MQKFCEECRDLVDCSVREEKKIITIKDVELEYVGKEVYCKECGANIFHHEIHDYNLNKINEEYEHKKR